MRATQKVLICILQIANGCNHFIGSWLSQALAHQMHTCHPKIWLCLACFPKVNKVSDTNTNTAQCWKITPKCRFSIFKNPSILHLCRKDINPLVLNSKTITLETQCRVIFQNPRLRNAIKKNIRPSYWIKDNQPCWIKPVMFVEVWSGSVRFGGLVKLGFYNTEHKWHEKWNFWLLCTMTSLLANRIKKL